jgi:hypothetical protein
MAWLWIFDLCTAEQGRRRPVWNVAVHLVAAAMTSRLEEGNAHIARAGDLAIW